MENMHSIPQGLTSPKKVVSNRLEETANNLIEKNPAVSLPQFEPVSKGYANAMRSLAMSQITLGNKPGYYSPDIIYERFRR